MVNNLHIPKRKLDFLPPRVTCASGVGSNLDPVTADPSDDEITPFLQSIIVSRKREVYAAMRLDGGSPVLAIDAGLIFGDPTEFVLAEPLANVRHKVRWDRHQSPRPSPDEEQQSARPPGGVLIVACLSAASGAIMGLVFGGYLTAAITMFIAVPLGIGIGMWVQKQPD